MILKMHHSNKYMRTDVQTSDICHVMQNVFTLANTSEVSLTMQTTRSSERKLHWCRGIHRFSKIKDSKSMTLK